MLKMKVKRSFMLQSNDKKRDVVICAEALNTCVPPVLCVSNNVTLWVATPASTRNLVWHGETSTPSRRGCPTGVELSSVTFRRGRVKQGLSPPSDVPTSTERGYKPGLLVAEAIVKVFEKHWSILIDSGASCNYDRRRSLEGVSGTLKRSKRMKVIRLPFV